ncbi:hypothetical protein [Akkermansia muciniphila]|uniref:hypothetical protein n=1 Tax=Akkermansia muciniphila TaxID=239935 RepID=UPI001C05F096|nr:hypothetical protein [Akkermansia muciniphila]QWP41626.1 hypothetical protein J5W54_00505 [Akkermansia muciniphila]
MNWGRKVYESGTSLSELEQKRETANHIRFVTQYQRLLEVDSEREELAQNPHTLTERRSKFCPIYSCDIALSSRREDCRQACEQLKFKTLIQEVMNHEILSMYLQFGSREMVTVTIRLKALDIISIQEHESHPLIPEEIQALIYGVAVHHRRKEGRSPKTTRKKRKSERWSGWNGC